MEIIRLSLFQWSSREHRLMFGKFEARTPSSQPEDQNKKLEAKVNSPKSSNDAKLRRQDAERKDREKDIVAGRHLFENIVSCADCHSVKPGEIITGPSLSDIGSKYSKDEILENIIHPSNTIAPDYKKVTVVTPSGKSVSGVEMTSGKDKNLFYLKTEDGDVLEFPRVDEDGEELIVKPEPSQMPEGLLDGLSPEQITALLAYLKSQKSTEQVKGEGKDAMTGG
jgi:putative heme-binding domain-containing protein